MSQLIRQSELFAGQDWTTIYRAFSEVNLNAFDFDTIRQSMKDYIQRNYPEDFNDWIESSEFVALIDLLAYLGQSLAFRMDLDSRENFLELARSRESILKLARFLSYNPKRNYPARGLVKISQIRTTEDIYDSSGNNLNNVIIRWDDPNNPNWYEQFILVLNASLISTNPFGIPLKSSSFDSIRTELYRFENIPSTAGNIPFSAYVNNQTLSFDIINIDFNNTQGLIERSPDPISAMHILYRNDGNGNSSANTGFFFYFKQGTLSRSDFLINEPLENRTIDININNINEMDVWVQSVNDQGLILSNGEWTRVGYVPNDDINKVLINSENLYYNSINPEIQNIFQVISRENDQITLKFGDGRFGEIPTGNIRVWYRTSIGESFSISREDIQDLQISINYTSTSQQQKSISFSFGLQESIINSSPAETNSELRRRVGAVYSTQGRMVSGNDYNVLPLSNNIAVKTKAVNRIYSGQSRYLDLNDPTGSFQNTNVFSDDGSIYRDLSDQYKEISFNSNITNEEIIASYIIPLINGDNLRDFLYEEWLDGINKNPLYNFEYNNEVLWWQKSNNAIYSSSGRFAKSTTLPINDAEWNMNAIPLGYNGNPNTIEQYIKIGSMLKFKNAGWTTLSNLISPGNSFLSSGEGQVRLNESVNTGDQVIQILPTIKKVFSSVEYSKLLNLLQSKKTFGIGYNFINEEWYFILTSNISLNSSYDFSTKDSSYDSSWLIKCEYSPLNWRITSRGIRHIFESKKDVRFFFVNQNKMINPETGKAGYDTISILDNNLNAITLNSKIWISNTKYSIGDIISYEESFYKCITSHTSGETFEINSAIIEYDNGQPKARIIELWRNINPLLKTSNNWILKDTFRYQDGYIEPRRVIISLEDNDFDGQPDNPESFRELVGNNNWIIHQRQTDINGYSFYELKDNIKIIKTSNLIGDLDPGEVIYIVSENKFYQCNLKTKGTPIYGRLDEISPLLDQSEFQANIGRNNIHFNWKHYAPIDNRIDPSINNIIDIFTLTREYNDQMQTWALSGYKEELFPSPPSQLQLRLSFSELEQFKMFSDQIIWRPVKFKILFGSKANSELRAKFKIVKLSGTSLSDGEIKSRIIQIVQRYFNVNNWDFGETFYFTELAGYIHRQLINAISSVVIVPQQHNQTFGDLFEVRSQPDELFFPMLKVSDIEIIPSNTQTSLRIK